MDNQKNFSKENRGYLTFPTKFDMVDSICNIEHNNRIIVRMSVNPEKIINQVEFGTSKLKGRIESINKLKAAGYKLGILIAPVIMIDNWQEEYENLIKYLKDIFYTEIPSKIFIKDNQVLGEAPKKYLDLSLIFQIKYLHHGISYATIKKLYA